jgi:hypothetical protein
MGTNMEIRVHSASGAIVLTRKIANVSEDKLHIDTSHLQDGIYFLSIGNLNFTSFSRVVVLH